MRAGSPMMGTSGRHRAAPGAARRAAWNPDSTVQWALDPRPSSRYPRRVLVARKIVFVTGTRADFGKLRPLAEAARDAGHRIGFFVTGMHMLARYGLTKIEVHRVTGAEVFEHLNQQPRDGQDTVFVKTIIGCSDFLAEHRPDLVVVHGDRVEAMACALTCATNRVRRTRGGRGGIRHD